MHARTYARTRARTLIHTRARAHSYIHARAHAHTDACTEHSISVRRNNIRIFFGGVGLDNLPEGAVLNRSVYREIARTLKLTSQNGELSLRRFLDFTVPPAAQGHPRTTSAENAELSKILSFAVSLCDSLCLCLSVCCLSPSLSSLS